MTLANVSFYTMSDLTNAWHINNIFQQTTAVSEKVTAALRARARIDIGALPRHLIDVE